MESNKEKLYSKEEVTALLIEQSNHCFYLCESEVTTEDEGLNYGKFEVLVQENISILLT